MKILKPGKVEMRKFVCPDCGCEFVAHENDIIWLTSDDFVCCPTCEISQRWDNGEPYEEPTHTPTPTPTQDDRGRLENLLANSPMGTEAATEYLLSHGVTFREG